MFCLYQSPDLANLYVITFSSPHEVAVGTDYSLTNVSNKYIINIQPGGLSKNENSMWRHLCGGGDAGQ